MDPSWYFNRLGNASTFPPSGGASASEYHQQLTGHHSEGSAAATPASSSQLLQFNAGFPLSNPYSFYGIPHTSKTVPYAAVGQNRALATTTKPSSESRENYNPAHNQSSVTSTTYFEHQNSGSGAGSIGWTHHNPQLATGDAFGVLPHESITSSTSPKSGTSAYPYNAYSPHNVGNLTQPAGSSSYSDGKKSSRSQSPVSSSKNSSTGFSSYPSPAANVSNSYAAQESGSRSAYPSSVSSAVIQQQQSAKDFQTQQSTARTPDSNLYEEAIINRNKEASSRSQSFSTPGIKLAHPTKAQSKLYSDMPNLSESSRSAEVDRNIEHTSSSSQRYTSDSKQASGQTENLSGSGNFYDQLNFPYHYPLSDTAVFNRMKSELYLASQQNSTNCGKKPSHQAAPSQSAPLPDHVRSAYPLYNSPVTAVPTSSPQQHSATTDSCNQNSSSVDLYKPGVHANPPDIRDRNQSAHQNVAYSSVIRAVPTPDPVAKPVYQDTRLFERIQDQTPFPKQCWETVSEKQAALSQSPDSSSHQKKYPSTAVPAFDSGSTDMTSNPRQQPSRSSLCAVEKQSSYYDNTSAHQAALQNLSSYRDDPMSIIKDLQQQHYQSQQNHESSKSGDKLHVDQSAISNTKKRKSLDKHAPSLDSSEFYNNRVPPPAHNNMTFQQQQSGSYFPNFSPPSSSRSYPVSQVPGHYTSHPQSLMGQAQALYTPPFFSPFPVTGTSSTSTPSVSTSQSSIPSQTTMPSAVSEKSYPDNIPQAANSTSNKIESETTTVETVPKVVVPNVEEELSFLKEAGPVLMIKSDQVKKNSSTSGFEASFLKFLQGEREASPPPPSRSSRRSNYSKGSRTQQHKLETASSSSSTNGASEKTNVTPSSSVISNTVKDKVQPLYDPKDDPRYFPLPKTDAERKVSSDSDSDVGSFSSVPVKNVGSKSQDRKPVAAIAPRTAVSKQISKAVPVTNSQPGKRGRKKKAEVTAINVPRRETSKRKAKEKGTVLLDDGDDEYPGKVNEGTDSDSDPAWTPMPVVNKPKTLNLDSSDDDSSKKRGPKKSTKGSGQGRKRSKPARSEDDGASSDDEKAKKHCVSTGSRGRRRSQNVQATSVKSSSIKSGDDNDVDGDDPEMSPFKVGDFIVMKTDLVEKWPPIWRVDGKTLLQKFEPFEQKGSMLYRNISTYSGWSPQNSQIYKPANVVFKVQNRTETVVEFIRDEMADDDDEALVELVKQTAKFQENFEVYIQTLISQALDSNFLTEIFQEKDEYFLSNVKTVDDIVDDKRKRFLRVVNWRPEFEASIATWPCYNVMYEMSSDIQKQCASCGKSKVAARVLLYGQPYNSTTLEGCQPDPKLTSEKDFFTCKICLKRIELYNKVAHQKYLMYIECSKRVNEEKQIHIFKETTDILNELLADDIWLDQLFRNVRILWAQVDRLEHSLFKN